MRAELRRTVETASPTGEIAVERPTLPDRRTVEHELAGLARHPVEASRFERALKRGFDLIATTLLLTVFAPLLAAIALIVKLDSPGPVLFRQRRIGRGSEPFEMVKFRTMIEDADVQRLRLLHMNEAAEGLFKIRQDPRVTRFGRLLRSTSLDELPQLIHVISGRMSLVGPRPLVPEEDARIEGGYRRRLEMRPGMTGVWQVAGASEIPIAEMVRLDLDYVRDWSLSGDLKLLAGTAQHVLQRRGI